MSFACYREAGLNPMSTGILSDVFSEVSFLFIFSNINGYFHNNSLFFIIVVKYERIS